MKLLINSIIIFLTFSPIFASESAYYPVIEDLNQSDIIFKQVTMDITSYYQNIEQNKKLAPLQLYSYTLKEDTTIFRLAARFNIPYESISTLNSINHPETLNKGTTLLIPNSPGIFVREKPVTDLELMIRSWRDLSDSTKLVIENGGRKLLYFLPGERFHKVERAFFLGIMFRFPLKRGYISSGFGNRVHPISGTIEFHNGIDIAAPMGTDIMAARGGTIKFTGKNNICGNYIIISHENNYETVYCHLKKIFVQLNQQVQSGMIIGQVGTTGMSTGPHLHFEIRTSGTSKDPTLLLPGNNQ